METKGEIFYEAPKGKITLNNIGLSEDEAKTITEVAKGVFDESKKRASYALERCTFFADYGYDALSKIVESTPTLVNPRIEGCDINPTNQHYWVAADLVRGKDEKAIIFDPIFGYVGLEEEAPKILSPDYITYYKEKRFVKPWTAYAEGGVRINTMGI